MEKTKTYNYEGIAEYNYKIVSFGYTELIIISLSYDGSYVQVYKLDNYSIKHAMTNYHNFIHIK